MKYLFLIFFSTSLLASTSEWTTGSTKISLSEFGKNGYVSNSCIKGCKLKTLVEENRKKLRNLDLSGGKDPASVFCKEIRAKVIYLSHKDQTETFCVMGNDIISLSLLLN